MKTCQFCGAVSADHVILIDVPRRACGKCYDTYDEEFLNAELTVKNRWLDKANRLEELISSVMSKNNHLEIPNSSNKI